MFDREKQVIINKICKSIFSKSDSITFKELNLLNLPIQLKNYLGCILDLQLEKETIELKNFSRFNYDHPDVKPFFDQLCVMLKIFKSFTYQELSVLLKDALDLTLDYLLKPCEVLTNFVFKYDSEIDSNTLLKKLEFITDYNYLTTILKELVKRKKISTLERQEFYELLKKIDKEYTNNFTLLDHYELFKSFKEYLIELELVITDRAEYEAFIIYLNDKSHKNAVEFLEERRNLFIQSNTSVLEYLKILFQPKLYEEKKVETLDIQAEAKEIDLVETEKKEEQLIDSRIESVLQNQEEITESENSEKVSETVMSELGQVEEKSDSIKTDDPKEKSLYQKLITPEAPIQKKYDRNLDGLMSRRLKKKVIYKIFDGNEFLFYDFINKLNKVSNWDEASILLTDLFDKRNIQPFSKWAIKFTEFLYDNIR